VNASTRTAKSSKQSKSKALAPLLIDGNCLTRAHVIQVAVHGRQVAISGPALKRVERAAKFLQNELKRGEPLYGVTTGFGSNADRLLGNERLRPERAGAQGSLIEELQRNLIISHAVCVGEPLPEPVARAMLLIRLNTLLSGHSGIRGHVLQLMQALLNAGVTPVVPELGSVGASGDLAPLSHLALPLLGLGEVFYQGQRLSSEQVLTALKLEPVKLSCKEGLALNNGTTQMLATGVLLLDRMDAMCKQADINAALCLEAFCGRSAAFEERVHSLRPHPGQIKTAFNLRKLIKSSRFVDIAYHLVPRFSQWTPTSWPQLSSSDAAARTFDLGWDYIALSERAGRDHFYTRNLPFRGGKKFQPQDSYSLRCVPQVHGAVKDSLAHIASVLDIELNSVTDNPLIFPQADAGESSVISAGHFHGMPLALVLAQLKTAIPVLASIAERRLNKMLDPATNDGLPPFLIGNEDGTDSGLMIVQYSAAAIVNELATLAHPACVYSVPTSANAEDHVSMGTNDARHAWRMMQGLESVLALELLTQTQALDYRRQVLAAAGELAEQALKQRSGSADQALKQRSGSADQALKQQSGSADQALKQQSGSAGQQSIQALRTKVRNAAGIGSAEAEVLATDIKRLQQDLRKLKGAQPGPVAAKLLDYVRKHGVSFMSRDRVISADIAAAEKLVRERALIALAESQLGLEL
jgi:histidine ammonia-lyase